MNAASPEPVPATNQAGEVERLRADMYGMIFFSNMPMAARLLLNRAYHALATQPATSQEGEALATIASALGDFDAAKIDSLTVTRRIGNALHMAGAKWDNKQRRYIFAATPTPPTLSEDLREAAQAVVDAAPTNGNDRPHPATYWAGIIGLRAALAQVKAS